MNESNLVLNHSKMKIMLFSTSKLASYHDLENRDINLRTGSIPIEKETFRDLHLETYIEQHLKWDENVTQVSTSSYQLLATLRKLRTSAVIPKELTLSMFGSF